MLYSEIIDACSAIHTKHTNTLCEQNAELWTMNLGTLSNQWPLRVNDTSKLNRLSQLSRRVYKSYT
jgi:hypothetical protein